MSANKKNRGTPNFNEDSARRAVGGLFDDDAPEAPLPGDDAEFNEPSERELRPEHVHPARKPELEEEERRRELEREDYINTTIRSTRELEEKRMLRGGSAIGGGTRYKDYIGDIGAKAEEPATPKPAKSRPPKPSSGFPELRILALATAAVVLLIFAFLVFTLNSTNKKLAKSEELAHQYQQYGEENQLLAVENSDLRRENQNLHALLQEREAELDALAAQAEPEPPASPVDAVAVSSNPSQPVTSTTPAGGQKIHTITKGETIWGIAVAYYGDGSKYPKILEANGIKEEDAGKILEGAKLVIPSL